MDPALYALIGVVLAALIGQVVQLRKMSGAVGTSEAQTLWEASDRIQQAQAKELESLKKRVDSLEADRDELRTKNLQLMDDKLKLEREKTQWQERCEALYRENGHLKTLIEKRLGEDPGDATH